MAVAVGSNYRFKSISQFYAVKHKIFLLEVPHYLTSEERETL